MAEGVGAEADDPGRRRRVRARRRRRGGGGFGGRLGGGIGDDGGGDSLQTMCRTWCGTGYTWNWTQLGVSTSSPNSSYPTQYVGSTSSSNEKAHVVFELPTPRGGSSRLTPFSFFSSSGAVCAK